jgi:solute carrier family 13 (sodium-dependent dicarboxylate transporter), member 2/3/5
LFAIPSSKGFLLVPRDVLKIPFEIILLFGGGFAMAMGIEESGMSNWMASGLEGFSSSDPILFVAIMALLICVISEFASNVACIQLMIPILMAFYAQLGVSALFLMVPATLAASLGFMLPVATGPNTIVFGTKKIKTAQMLKAGMLLDIAGILLITLFVWLFGDALT